MSFKYYTNWWIKNKAELEDLTKKDNAFLRIPNEVKERQIANKLVGGMYARYCMLVKELDICLDQLAQPQKTVTVRKLVESAVLRLKELYNELRWIDFSEYHYIDDSLIELKLIPHDIEFIHPYLSYPRPYDIQQMYDRFKNGERIYTKPIITNPEGVQETPVDATTEENIEAPDSKKRKKKMQTPLIIDQKEQLTPEEIEHKKREEVIKAAVDLIQRHERARQARLYHSEINVIYLKHLEESKPGKREIAKEAHTLEEKVKAATTIQKVYRGYFCRKYLKYREEERRILLGMYEKSFRSRKEFDIEEQEIEKRRRLRELRIKEYIDGNLAEKERVLRVVGPGLMEDIGDEIREWFYQWYIRAKNFDKYPPEEKGGTILVVRGETMTPEEWIEEVERRRREKARAKGNKQLKEKLKAEKAKKKAAEKAAKKQKQLALKQARKEKKRRRNDTKNYQMEFDDPEGKELYAEGQKEHKLVWDFRDELLNPEEKHYMDIITEQRCYEVQLEMRKIVDEMMRLELELLNDALARDRNKKPKKGKKGKKKKKKRKRKGKKRGGKDLTADRTTEDLFQELIDNGIIRLYPKTRLDEFVGDMSYKNYELRFDEYLEPPACLGDVRQAIAMNCILPLGLEVCKTRTKSMIIVGTRQSGKKILANAIFTATRCVLFDLSPSVIAGKYPEKAGLVMLTHLVMKMARILQPSILYIDGAEKTFYKKVPPAEKSLEPKRLGKVLLKKMVKTIRPDDRVMLLGISSQPWLAQAKMKKLYERVILIPRSDYGSLYLYWRHLMMPYHSVDRNMDLSCLARLTANYPLGVLKEVTTQVMTPARIVESYYTPFRQEELFEPFLKIDPITDKMWKKYEKWYMKTQMGKLKKKFTKNKLKIRENILKMKAAEEKNQQKAKKRKP
ncbi:hypothetical protein WA026_003009 [Henosepilachna vigintioctopunctata]|uniref:ATPase AAA-type core domain-containing protein n=1 Tax=Henosepilachna vigintioctopunctata TaxID=420089 RepID=A0AAW1TIU0_9CUCU